MLSTMSSLIARFARWFAERNTVPRACLYSRNFAANSEGDRCDKLISADESKRLGHQGYCSAEHQLLDLENAPI